MHIDEHVGNVYMHTHMLHTERGREGGWERELWWRRLLVSTFIGSVSLELKVMPFGRIARPFPDRVNWRGGRPFTSGQSLLAVAHLWGYLRERRAAYVCLPPLLAGDHDYSIDVPPTPCWHPTHVLSREDWKSATLWEFFGPSVPDWNNWDIKPHRLGSNYLFAASLACR